MKKILLMLLTLAIVFSLASCGLFNKDCTEHVDEDKDGKCDNCKADVDDGKDDGKDDGTTDDGGDDTQNSEITLADYTAAMTNTTPATVTIRTAYANKAPAVTLEGEYVVTYNVDGTATIVYSYDVLNDIGASEMMTKKTGTVELLADGTASGDLNEAVKAAAINKISLDASKMDYEISMGVLNAVISAANTEAVFGIDFGSEVTLLMRITDDGKIGSYSLSYSTAAGDADIVCMFS